MSKTYRPYEPDQLLLLPPSLQEWIPDGHLSRFIHDLVDTLDLSAIEDTYREERGYPPYHPRMMLKVLLYAYATGVYSSRRIAEKLTDSVALRFLAAGNAPDFRTISEFRKRHGVALNGLFDQVLLLCREAGLVKLGRVAVDGTKVKANASKHKAMSYGRMKQKETETRRIVRALLARADAADREEDARYGPDKSGYELPAELATHEGRLKKIREAKEALEAEARKKAEDEGRGGVGPKPPDRAQRNFTDPESKIQKTKDGFIQGYNAQLAVDAEHQVIVAQHVTAKSVDVGELVRSVESIKRVMKRQPKEVLADAGYYSESNVEALRSRKIDPYIATSRLKHGAVGAEPKGRVPAALTIRQRMARKLRTKRGRKIYSRRKTIVEPAIGQIKQARGFRQFLRRGVSAVSQEWSLVCTVHNILKLRTALSDAS